MSKRPGLSGAIVDDNKAIAEATRARPRPKGPTIAFQIAHQNHHIILNHGARAMSAITDAPLRTTQRAPRSCSACASRKVKCDKMLPCSTCTRRGEADSCRREQVIVRGEVKIAKDPPGLPTYEALVEENRRLCEDLLVQQSILSDQTEVRSSLLTTRHRPRHILENQDAFEELLWKQDVPQPTKLAYKVFSWQDITFPSRACSDELISYDKMWNSWVHCALEYPRYEEDYHHFMDGLEVCDSLHTADSPWLAVYFSILCAALLMMDDDHFAAFTLPSGYNREEMTRHWFDAAVFCLHQADFLRIPKIQTIQAIVILGICFNNLGEVDLGNHLWSCAIRIAQRLGLDAPYSQLAAPMSPEAQHRLWWTLTICEWLAVPYRPPQIEEADFDVPLPTVDDEEAIEGHIQPVHYHIFMARTSTVYYRFRAAIRTGTMPLDEVVRAADSDLAEVINTLPEYLQPDNGNNDDIQNLEAAQPWVKWQRFDITLVLLHHRIRINRVLQREWLSFPRRYEWARAVCLKSAMDIIWISHNWDQPPSMRKQWALSLHIFVAAILLIRESLSVSAQGDNNSDRYRQEIETALALLDQVKSWNAIAYRASEVLNHVLHQNQPLPN